MKRSRGVSGAGLFVLALTALLGGAAGAAAGACGPFTDVSDATFCPFVLEIFSLGITTGTTPTTYGPTDSVSRLQMAAFLSRTVDALLQRGHPRTLLNESWTPRVASSLGVTTLGSHPSFPVSDGVDVWVPIFGDGAVSRVRASSGRLLETWTDAPLADQVLVAMGRILVTGWTNPGRLYAIDPAQPAGSVTTVASNLGGQPSGIAFDGARVFTGNYSGSVSIVTPSAAIPWSVTTVTAGFSQPLGAIYDGANVWVADLFAGTLLRLDSAGAILQTVTLETGVLAPVFDGINIWVPGTGKLWVVRASTGAVLATITDAGGRAAAFDGERILVTHFTDTVSLFKAADLTSLGSASVGPGEADGVCSDGVHFWITLQNGGKLLKF